jgi:hypothetical protein
MGLARRPVNTADTAAFNLPKTRLITIKSIG